MALSKEEELLKAQLTDCGYVVDINFDHFPHSFVVTYSAKRDALSLLGQSNSDSRAVLFY